MKPQNEKAVFESHITVDGTDEAIAQFKEKMKSMDIKVISVGNGYPVIDHHHMTSVICTSQIEANAVEDIVRLTVADIEGLNISRIKLERSPSLKGSVCGDSYYECHVEVFESAVTKKLYDPAYWFVSKNTNKVMNMPNGKLEPLYMLTARNKNISLAEFTEMAFSKMLPFVYLIAVKDKVFIEECVYDSNEQLDAHWMNIAEGSVSSEEVVI